MNRISMDDRLYALILDDNDDDYTQIDTSDDEVLLSGNWTDSYNRFAGDEFHLPNVGLGEYSYGWWLLDFDGDSIADGTDPTNWDTDGDWLNDRFEIADDLLDALGGIPAPLSDMMTDQSANGEVGMDENIRIPGTDQPVAERILFIHENMVSFVKQYGMPVVEVALVLSKYIKLSVQNS